MFVAGRSHKSGKRMGTELGPKPQLAQSTMGVNLPSPKKTQRGQRICNLLPPSVENSSLVVQSPKYDDHRSRNQGQCATIPESKGGKNACPSLGNPLRSATGLNRSQLALRIRQLEALHDIPIAQRLKWMQTAQLEIPEHRGPLIAGIKRLKATAKGPKYPVFYDISPLINFSFPDPSPNFNFFNIAQTLDILIMQLRLTTLMRAADLSTIPWAIFHMNPKGNWTQEKPLFIHSTTKNGTRKTFSIFGTTATTLLHYIWLHLKNPAPFLLRHSDNPHKCLGSERISKRCLNILTNLDIDTQIFKSHSIRGATATQLAKQGVPLPWIQNRGGWQSPETLQKIAMHCTKDKIGPKS